MTVFLWQLSRHFVRLNDMKLSIFFLFFPLSITLFASLDSNMPLLMPKGSLRFSLENRILTHVGKKPISVLDVKKQMDLFYHKQYPNLYENDYARLQFYQMHWKNVLKEIIHTELILLDAEEKKVTVSKGEIHEALINRFGPSVLQTLEKIDISYEEAEESIKQEMIVQRMMWFYVNQKAIQSVHPQDIRSAYRKFLTENPGKQEWRYRIISIKGRNSSLAAESMYAKIRSDKALNLTDILSSYRRSNPNLTISLSSEYEREESAIARADKNVLATLSPGDFSQPITHTNRKKGKEVQKIFYLKDATYTPPASLEEKYASLRQELMQQAAKKYNQEYVNKLQKLYGVSTQPEDMPRSFQPFVIRQ